MHGRQVIAQIEVAVSDDVTALVFRNLEPLDDYDLSILIDYAKQSGLIIYLQPGGVETIKPLWPESPSLSYVIPEYDIRIEFLPGDFTQVNASINQQMVTAAIDLLQVKPDESVLDLFCGLGNFTSAIARKAHQVTGIEGDEGLVDRARQNAVNNHLDNIQFSVANLFEDIALQSWSHHQYDKLLLDPPRSGAQAIAEHINRINPGRIVYVSCHPATLARDAAILVDKCYRLLQTGIMDMFPHTMHVESIAVFERT
jgi:23S rRNA (uracil1939-C5)-methyltransferase